MGPTRYKCVRCEVAYTGTYREGCWFCGETDRLIVSSSLSYMGWTGRHLVQNDFHELITAK